jgi:hypothetical protein
MRAPDAGSSYEPGLSECYRYTKSMKSFRLPAWRVFLSVLALLAALGCAGEVTVDDPLRTLGDPESNPRELRGAMRQLDADPQNAEYIKVLRRMMHRPGYTIDLREEALNRLDRVDPVALRDTLKLHMPKLDALEWRRRLCEIFVERGWTDLSPTLVRSWAFPIAGWVESDEDRPERQALEKLHGREGLPDYIFQTLLESDPVREQNLRARCWEMMLRLGQRDRLVALLQDASVKPDDAMLIDLRAAASELGVIPSNREEILWLRKLREPQRADFWSDAVRAMQAMPSAWRPTLEIRDLPIAVAALHHRPQLLQTEPRALYAEAEQLMSGRKTYSADFEGWGGEQPFRLQDWRKRLTWGDLAAIHLALQALSAPEMTRHIYDYAERDQKDLSTEYGGVVRLDEKGRFELVEFQPRVRGNDERFESSQEMMDAGYAALFHFHNHTMRYENSRYAGPHVGDFNYADNTRTNCLVFTFIDHDTINADFYRHGRVVVDLGEIRRPSAP